MGLGFVELDNVATDFKRFSGNNGLFHSEEPFACGRAVGKGDT